MTLSPQARVRRVFLTDMVISAAIGVHPHEHGARQRIRVNLELRVPDEPGPDRLERVVDYEKVANAVRDIVGTGHVKLVETLAERIAAACLSDGRVLSALVRVEKLDAFTDVGSAGVEIERVR